MFKMANILDLAGNPRDVVIADKGDWNKRTRWQEILDAEGISEDEAVADFKQSRIKQKR